MRKTWKTNRYAIITKKNSKTFYYSSLLFPKGIREKIFLVYSFVRTVDNLVDRKKPKKKELNAFFKQFDLAWHGKKIKNILINDFVNLAKTEFNKKWIDDFFLTQKQDALKKKYRNFKELEKFAYGVAGTIGLMIASLLKLPKKTFNDAVKLGNALQLINCCRDVVEDYQMGKVYLPISELKKHGLNLKNFLKKNNQKKLFSTIFSTLKKAFKLIDESKKSFVYFEKRPLLAVKTATDLYKSIGKKIEKNPELIFEKDKLKPSKLEIIFTVFKNFILVYGLNKKN